MCNIKYLTNWVFQHIIGLTTLGASVLVVLSFAFIPKYTSYKPEDLAALFTGLAFAAMVGTLLLQKQELKDTRLELKRTADANAKSAELAKDNLEAQYLFFCLSEEKDNYRAYKNFLNTSKTEKENLETQKKILEDNYSSFTSRIKELKKENEVTRHASYSNVPFGEIGRNLEATSHTLGRLSKKLEKLYLQTPTYKVIHLDLNNFCKKNFT